MRTRLELDTKQSSESFYNDRFSTGYMDEWPLWKQRRVAEIIRSTDLPTKGNALDFGCGTEVFTEVLRGSLPPSWVVYGTDLSPVAIKIARSRRSDCDFFELDKLLIQLRSGKVGSEFDHVVSHGGVIDRAFDQVVEDEADLCCRAPVPSEAELVEVLL